MGPLRAILVPQCREEVDHKGRGFLGEGGWLHHRNKHVISFCCGGRPFPMSIAERFLVESKEQTTAKNTGAAQQSAQFQRHRENIMVSDGSPFGGQ